MLADPSTLQLSPEMLLHMPMNGGVNREKGAYQIGAAVPNLLNMYSIQGPGMEPFPGMVALGADPEATPVVHFARFESSLSGQQLLAVTLNTIFQWVTPSWSTIVGGLGAYSSYAPVGVQAVDSSGVECFIYSNLYTDIKIAYEWGASGSGDLAGADGVYRCKAVGYLDSTLFLVDVADFPYNFPGGDRVVTRVRWSDKGDIESYTAANYIDLLADPSPGMAFKSFTGKFGLIWKKRSIYSVVPTGSATEPYRFHVEVKGIGTVAGATVATFGLMCIFLSDGAVYKWNLGGQPEDISGPIKKILFHPVSGINQIYVEKAVGFIDTSRSLYWLSVPLDVQTNPSAVFCYHIPTGRWFMGNATISAFGEYRDSTDDYVVVAGDLTTDAVVEFDPTNYNNQGSGVINHVHSKEWMLPGYNVRNTRLDFEAIGTNVTVAYSIDAGKTWTTIETITLDALEVKQYVCYHDITGNRIRYRFNNNAVDGWFEIFWVNASGMQVVAKQV